MVFEVESKRMCHELSEECCDELWKQTMEELHYTIDHPFLAFLKNLFGLRVC